MKIPLRQYWKLLVKYIKPQWPRALLMTVLLLTGIGLELLAPQILRLFIDAALAKQGMDQLVWLALLYLGIALVVQVASLLATYTSENVGWNATNALRNDLAAHCLRLDMPFYHSHTPGVMIERLDGDITALATFFSEFVIRVLGNLLLLGGILVILFLEDWRVGLALALFAAGAVYVLNRTRNLAVPRTHQERESSANLYGFLEERLAGLEDLRANGGERYTMRRFTQVVRDFFYTTRRARMMFAVLWLLVTVFFTSGYVMALGMGAYLFVSGAITLGTVYLFYQYTEMFRNPLEQMIRQIQELQKASAGILRVQELLNIAPSIKDGSGKKLPGGPLSLEYDNVSFGYNPDEPVLQNISFRLEPGRVLGVLGRTGSGKTTTARLLFRLYEATAGQVRVGGVAIKDTRLAELRRRVGMVTQEVQIFHASVRDNLTFFDRSIPDERILEALRELGLWDWYQGLPEGLDSELAGNGGGLSAGEAQLLAFTRLFLEDPGLVVLDEASSRLDPATERLIETGVDKLMRTRTGLIIAHRLATVERADDILILDHGRVVEYGPRLSLAADPDSRFYRLLQVGLEETLV